MDAYSRWRQRAFERLLRLVVEDMRTLYVSVFVSRW
jgi:hypothetical protein